MARPYLPHPSRLAPHHPRRAPLIPIGHGLLKAGTREIFGEPEQALLRILHPLIVGKRSDLLENVVKKSSRLQITHFLIQVAVSKSLKGIDDFRSLFFGQRERHGWGDFSNHAQPANVIVQCKESALRNRAWDFLFG